MRRQSFSVSFDFPVVFTRDVVNPRNPVLAEAIGAGDHRVVAYVDSGVARAHPGLCRRLSAYFRAHPDHGVLVAPPEIIPGGERAKNDWSLARRLINQFRDLGLCRQSYVLAVGGGAVLDAVGFAASLFHRGLRLVRLPTTVLAQNDVGVGVKNALNGPGVKNLVGTFSPPYAVVNDLDFLRTLSDRDWIGGIAEAFKVAIIRDRAFFLFLCATAARLRRRDEAAMERLIRRCADLHLDHIRTQGDPFETGRSRPLDFGHWAAHRLEIMTRHRLGHGQAVALGLTLDSVYARLKGWLTDRERQAIRLGLEQSGFALWHPALAQRDRSGRLELLRGLDDFREHLGGRLLVTFPRGIGRRHEVDRMDPSLIEASVREMASWRRPARRRDLLTK